MINLNTGCVDEKKWKWIPLPRDVTKSGVTVFWVTPSFGYPRITSGDTQNTKSELNKSLHGASNMACRRQKIVIQRNFSQLRLWLVKISVDCCEASWKERSVISFMWVTSHVNSAADRFETYMEGGYFLLLGFRVLENDRTLYFLISSASVNNHNCLTCLHTCVWVVWEILLLSQRPQHLPFQANDCSEIEKFYQRMILFVRPWDAPSR